MLLGLDVVQVEAVERSPTLLTVTVSSPPGLMGCPRCGVVAVGRGRKIRVLHDVPGEVPVVLRWRQRTWRCPDPGCPVGSFTEQLPDLVPARGSLTCRAVTWAIAQLRREHACVSGLARRLAVAWKTLWRAVRPRLQARAEDPARFTGVTSLGVDEHIWHHGDTRRRGPKELTGMVDLTRHQDEHGRWRVRARLLDLVPGRSKKAYADWLTDRGATFRDGVQVAALDPFGGYKAALDAELADAVAVLDAFHVVKLGTQVVDEVRRRVQQATTGHRGRKGDPLYGIQTLLRAGAENLTDKQLHRLEVAITADDAHEEVYIAWRCAQDLRAAYRTKDTAEGRRRAEKILASFHTCPIAEVARLGRTLRRWQQAFLAYFTTDRANNGGTEAVNGIIELHRRIARGYRNRDNYRLRMLLAAGGLNA
ncbi:ISL3 family transposase [Cellulomonas marina]|uniref:Transposase n=1 Tax=Cellulomonas marina TaxID=988821 RepID=A0A1I1A2V6_9CELL|nr:ISL3 family transposase [Cellulomonas marina]SFA92549.1 Transposase [Cellulomonas marina]SFB30733.1 Transposase [Cellulomonas marina]SFB33752.1 Transposase [Cellulomonas marina]SFB35544.1 Transposase [Cellulomonas marina]GIG30839.1 ISL3 family transposase [Cellulomonas marina]